MARPGIAEPKYRCQVCDAPLESKDSEDLMRQLQLWCLHTFTHSAGEMNILTCPVCSWLSQEAVVTGYMKRIASGRDLSYH